MDLCSPFVVIRLLAAVGVTLFGGGVGPLKRSVCACHLPPSHQIQGYFVWSRAVARAGLGYAGQGGAAVPTPLDDCLEH